MKNEKAIYPLIVDFKNKKFEEKHETSSKIFQKNYFFTALFKTKNNRRNHQKSKDFNTIFG
jgi:hypothetical protein